MSKKSIQVPTITPADVVMAQFAYDNVYAAEEQQFWTEPTTLRVAEEAVDLSTFTHPEHNGRAAAFNPRCLHCVPGSTREGAAHVLAGWLDAEGYTFPYEEYDEDAENAAFEDALVRVIGLVNVASR